MKQILKLQGQLNYRDKDLLTMSAAEMNKVRGSNIGMIFQEPLTALDPLMTVGKQIEENLDYHTNLSKLEKKRTHLRATSSSWYSKTRTYI